MKIKDKLIVALDVDTLKKAKYFVDLLYPEVRLFKIGSQLFTACGPEAIKMVSNKGARVFLDLKFHDIPHTVYLSIGTGAACSINIMSPSAETKTRVEDTVMGPVFMMTVHTKGGRAMLEGAARAAKEKANELKIVKPYIVGVTRLTSDEEAPDTLQEVINAAKLAQDAGLDGVVCSAHEAEAVRKECGRDFIIVTPGIRLNGAQKDDQRRVTTAQEAIKAGSDFLVVGRPILEAKDPLKAVKEIIGSL